jgi:hypothetical protein
MARNILSGVDLNAIDEKKAKFIYEEAMKFHQGMIESNDYITNKAYGFLSITMPIMIGLIGFLALRFRELYPPLSITAICACVFFLGIIILLLWILLPRGVSQGAGSPEAYLQDEYYKRDMRGIYIGNIETLDKYISQDSQIVLKRGKLLRIVIILYGTLPIACLLVYFFCNLLVPRCGCPL